MLLTNRQHLGHLSLSVHDTRTRTSSVASLRGNRAAEAPMSTIESFDTIRADSRGDAPPDAASGTIKGSRTSSRTREPVSSTEDSAAPTTTPRSRDSCTLRNTWRRVDRTTSQAAASSGWCHAGSAGYQPLCNTLSPAACAGSRSLAYAWRSSARWQAMGARHDVKVLSKCERAVCADRRDLPRCWVPKWRRGMQRGIAGKGGERRTKLC